MSEKKPVEERDFYIKACVENTSNEGSLNKYKLSKEAYDLSKEELNKYNLSKSLNDEIIKKLNEVTLDEPVPVQPVENSKPCGEIPVSPGWEFPRITDPPLGIKTSFRYSSKKIKKSNLEDQQWRDASSPSESEDFDDIRFEYKIQKGEEVTHLYAVAVDVSGKLNVPLVVKCNGCEAIGGYAKDQSRDVYVIKGVEYFKVAEIPVSYSITMDGVGNWRTRTPVPVKIIDRMLTASQKETLEQFRKRKPAPAFEIHFVQMVEF